MKYTKAAVSTCIREAASSSLAPETKLPAPPSSITGVQNTLSQDWIGFSLPRGSDLQTVERLFGDMLPPDTEWEDRHHGGNNRPESYTRSGVTAFVGSERLGAFVVLDGRGSGLLASSSGFPGWQEVAIRVLRFGGKATRLDLALDDRAGLLDIAALIDCCETGSLSTRAARYRPYVPEVEFGQGSQGKYEGVTFGSRQSETYLRIYDKAREQGRKTGVEHAHWIRVEMELKGARAQAVLKLIAERGIGVYHGLLRAYVEFKSAPARGLPNPDRVPVLPAWLLFVEAAVKLRVHIPPPLTTFDRIQNFVARQSGVGMATIYLALGPEMFRNTCEGVALDAVERMAAKHHEALDMYRYKRAEVMAA